jgi:hypothetical protein
MIKPKNYRGINFSSPFSKKKSQTTTVLTALIVDLYAAEAYFVIDIPIPFIAAIKTIVLKV